MAVCKRKLLREGDWRGKAFPRTEQHQNLGFMSEFWVMPEFKLKADDEQMGSPLPALGQGGSSPPALSWSGDSHSLHDPQVGKTSIFLFQEHKYKSSFLAMES